ncbi:MAG: SRPBCC family protein [Myxococcota bacterium]
MEIKNSFEVAASPEAAWKFLLTPEDVVPCIPGASLVEVREDGTWVAKAKIKLGPVTLSYKGKVNVVEQDDASYRVVLKGSGTETKGKGTVKADVISQLTPLPNGGTKAEITTDLTITGKAAQFGRGLIADVSTKFTNEFAEAMEYKLAGATTEAAGKEAEEAAAAAAKAAEEAKKALEEANKDDDEPPSAGGGGGTDTAAVAAAAGSDAAIASIEALIARAEDAAKRAEKAAKKAEASQKVAEASAATADAAVKRISALKEEIAFLQKEKPEENKPVSAFGIVWFALVSGIKRLFGIKPKAKQLESDAS